MREEAQNSTIDEEAQNSTLGGDADDDRLILRLSYLETLVLALLRYVPKEDRVEIMRDAECIADSNDNLLTLLQLDISDLQVDGSMVGDAADS